MIIKLLSDVRKIFIHFLFLNLPQQAGNTFKMVSAKKQVRFTLGLSAMLDTNTCNLFPFITTLFWTNQTNKWHTKQNYPKYNQSR